MLWALLLHFPFYVWSCKITLKSRARPLQAAVLSETMKYQCRKSTEQEEKKRGELSLLLFPTTAAIPSFPISLLYIISLPGSDG